jgi:hypothetical protein
VGLTLEPIDTFVVHARVVRMQQVVNHSIPRATSHVGDLDDLGSLCRFNADTRVGFREASPDRPLRCTLGARYVGIDRYDRFALVLCGHYFVPKTVFNGLDV